MFDPILLAILGALVAYGVTLNQRVRRLEARLDRLEGRGRGVK